MLNFGILQSGMLMMCLFNNQCMYGDCTKVQAFNSIITGFVGCRNEIK